MSSTTLFFLEKDIINPITVGNSFIETLIPLRVTYRAIDIEYNNMFLLFEKPTIEEFHPL